MSYLKKSLLLTALLATWSTGPLLAAGGGHAQSVDGMDVYIASLPEVMIKDHRIVAPGEDGVATREHHVAVALADQETGRRIEDAQVAALLQQEGQPDSFRRLSPMELTDTITYGDFFSFPEDGGYQIQLHIDRPGKPTTVVWFRHRHDGV